MAFPDVNFGIDDLFAEGDRVAIRFTWTGTHKATFLGITFTEHHVTVPGIDIFHIAGGKIVEVRVAFDRLELIEQLGGITHPL
jgi:predicted ester cyclase